MKQHQGPLLPFISIDRSSPIAVFRQLEDQFRDAILGGNLRGGSRLPASRVLAVELGVSRPTVVQVLENLKSEGYLEARRGSGTFVADGLPCHLPQPPQANPRKVAERVNSRISRIGRLVSAMTPDLSKAIYQPFLPNSPAFDEFPFAKWRRCWNGSARAARLDTMGYGDPAGYAPLRRCIAEYLALYRSDKCDPEQIVITPGSHAAFSLAALLLADPGDEVWFEDPGPITVRRLFSSLALNVCPVKVDEDGMDVDAARNNFPDARLAFVMPSRQHPLGVTLSLTRRLALLEWAQHNQSWIIEDDYDSEFRYVGRPLASMRSIDAAGRVIYTGTFSKALFPSMRVGYLVLPPSLVGLFRNLGGLMSRSVPVEMQAALAEFIGGGHFVTHLRRMRDLYAVRREAFVAAARTTLSGLARVEYPDSGMNAIAWLGSGVSDTAAYLEALREGIQCYPISDYTWQDDAESGLILGFTGVKPKDLMPGLTRLTEAITRQANRNNASEGR